METLQSCPQLKFLIPCSSADARFQISAQLKQLRIFEGDPFFLVDDSHAAIGAANLVVLASGTATLETLLLRRPMIVCYKLAAITYAIASRMVKIPYVALPNLLAGKQLVPEYIQQRVTVPRVRDEIISCLQHPEGQATVLAQFDTIHHMLRRDASREAAKAIAGLLATGARR